MTVATSTPAQRPRRDSLFQAAFDSEGRLRGGEWDRLRGAIFAGGMRPALRPAVWPFLVGYYAPDSTEAERLARAPPASR